MVGGTLSYAVLLASPLASARFPLCSGRLPGTLPDVVSDAVLTHANSNLIGAEQTGALFGPGPAGAIVDRARNDPNDRVPPIGADTGVTS